MIALYYILSFIALVTAQHFDFSASFVDFFKFHNSKLWDDNNGQLVCVGNDCAYFSKQKLKYDSKSPSGLLQIDFHNDCYGSHCCRNGKCTPYTTGRLSSTQDYGYGSFIFDAVAIQDFSYIVPSTKKGYQPISSSSCFTVRNYLSSLTPLTISLCVSSLDATKVTTVIHAGDFLDTQLFSLGFDATKTSAKYRIDYSPCCIKYAINGAVIKEYKAHKINIPRTEVEIRIGMFPDPLASNINFDTSQKQIPRDERPHIEMRMLLFRFRYAQNNEIFINHDEPIVIDSNLQNHIILPMGIFIVPITIICALVIFKKCNPSFEKKGHYVLIESSSCTK